MQSLCFLTLMMLAIKTRAMSGVPLICLSSPVVSVQAESTVVATIDNPQGKRCDAKLRFTNPDFLDVNFGFDFLKCMGSQIAEFVVPAEVPNGDAFVIWECAGEISRQCNHVSITEGSENPDTILYDQIGTIGCLVPTATMTTFSTVVDTTTTMTEPEISTAFSTSFSISSAGTATTAITDTSTTATSTTATSTTATSTTATSTTDTSTTAATGTATGTATSTTDTSTTAATETATGTATSTTDTSTTAATETATGTTTTWTTTSTQ